MGLPPGRSAVLSFAPSGLAQFSAVYPRLTPLRRWPHTAHIRFAPSASAVPRNLFAYLWVGAPLSEIKSTYLTQDQTKKENRATHILPALQA